MVELVAEVWIEMLLLLLVLLVQTLLALFVVDEEMSRKLVPSSSNVVHQNGRKSMSGGLLPEARRPISNNDTPFFLRLKCSNL